MRYAHNFWHSLAVAKKITTSTKQYTIRKIPRSVDLALKRKAKEHGLSLNAMILTLLKNEAHNRGIHPRKIDCDWEHS
jgi:predicted HicB family RNase H-like nuclease